MSLIQRLQDKSLSDSGFLESSTESGFEVLMSRLMLTGIVQTLHCVSEREMSKA